METLSSDDFTDTVTWFTLYEDTSQLTRVFDPSGRRQCLRLIKGTPPIHIVEGPIAIPVWFPGDPPVTDETPRVPMWHVRIMSMQEQHGTWWQVAGGTEADGVTDLEGWVLAHAFELRPE